MMNEHDSLKQPTLFSGTMFEENYLQRTHKTLTSNPIIALTELVANSWDTGASNVKITIPNAIDETITIEDDGTGMSEKEFEERWLTLSYK